VVRELEPELLVVCPPYDHAGAHTWAACRALGCKVVGFAMDEPLYAAARARAAIRPVYDAALSAFDRIYVAAAMNGSCRCTIPTMSGS
jgi:hypothetical protein